MYAMTSAVDPENVTELFALRFSTTVRHATPFAGFLRDLAAGYRVRVERAGEPGP